MKCIILAGGSGTRLWPLSRSHFPKQFLRIGDTESFLQKTIRRNLKIFGSDNLYILTNEAYFHPLLNQVMECAPRLKNNILLEPECKNTGPAVAFAIAELDPDEKEIFFITPSDHMISPQDKYEESIYTGAQLAEKGYWVTFGIRPTSPETGYGYIKSTKGTVEQFVEKPDIERAKYYLASGEYFWNSGMFAFTIQTFREEALKHMPELLEKSFEELPSISIDYALIEKSNRLAMVLLELTWSDIGSWENVYELLEKDEANNAIQGNVLAMDTRDSLIFAQNRLVSTIGLRDVLIVDTDDVVLVTPKGNAQKVKGLVEKLRTLRKKEIDEPLITERPWGSYMVLMEGPRHKIKRICINPKQKLSLQMHYHRSEHWVIVRGTALVTISNEETMLHEGESIFVPKSAIHRIENPGIVPLEMIEVQVGEYLGEDDIVRFEDIYGRLKEDAAFSLLLKKQ